MKTLTILLFAALITCTSTSATAGGFMKFDGVDGESIDKEHVGWSDLLSISWQMTSRLDRASGLPTGKRQHKPLTITKEIDKATPILMRLCADVTSNPEVEIHLTRAVGDDRQQTYLIIRMEDVLISSYSMDSADSTDPTTEVRDTEVLSLSYSKITWTYVDGGIEHTDDWAAPQ